MLHYLPASECQTTARLGLVIGKKQLKRAVDRNQVKRIVREQFRQLRAGLPVCDLIVRLMVKPMPFDRDVLRNDLTRLLARLGKNLKNA